MKEKFAPIVLFVYNRLFHTVKTIEALKNNHLSQFCDLFIYSDAPKSIKDDKQVNEVRNYIKTVRGFNSIEIIERESNLGLADSIIDGVSNIINKYGKVIVLEDDLITSQYFLKFMNDALSLYKNEKNIWEIGGYVYPIKNKSSENSYFVPLTTSWGWATWKDRWVYYEKNPKNLIESYSVNDIYKFNLNGSINLWSQVELNLNKRINTWAIFWYAVVFKNNGLVLYPKESIVSNIGHDGSGENCRKTIRRKDHLLKHEISLKAIENVEISEYHFNLIRKYLKNNENSLFKKIFRKLYGLIS